MVLEFPGSLEVGAPCCHCCGSDHCCVLGLIPAPGTSACHGCNQIKKKKNVNIRKCTSFQGTIWWVLPNVYSHVANTAPSLPEKVPCTTL